MSSPAQTAPGPQAEATSDPVRIRAQARRIWEAAVRGDFAGLTVDPAALDALAEQVAKRMRADWPDLQFPPSGIWRALEADDIDRFGIATGSQGFAGPEEFLLASADLAILASVFQVSAPAGWSFADPFSGKEVSGSAGLSVAALALLAQGHFSQDPARPLRVDAASLTTLSLSDFAMALDGEAEPSAHARQLHGHLVRLGEVIVMRPDLFNRGGALRPAHALLKALEEGDTQEALDAGALFRLLHNGLAPLWTGGARLGDLLLADAWPCNPASGEAGALKAGALSECLTLPAPDGTTAGHAVALQAPLSAMVFSLLEPLAWIGLALEDLEVVPPPADLAHLALMQQAGVLALSPATEGAGLAADPQARLAIARALTLAAVDLLAQKVRAIFEVEAEDLPLTLILEAGTRPLARAATLENSGSTRELASFLADRGVFWLPLQA
ncbi:DUF1688 family protein [Roseibium aestuarii]|uniref:DUF1688 family protein n=1 Tax=Roseibium aestuarii TaxID=2600299 RepID=A0ABW4JXS7_9HYPH|nr:DUF1688 family protein [Roseibium aestuarii]